MYFYHNSQVQHIELFEPVAAPSHIAVATWFKVCLYNMENPNQPCSEIHNILDMNISAIDVSEESNTLAVALQHKVCLLVLIFFYHNAFKLLSRMYLQLLFFLLLVYFNNGSFINSYKMDVISIYMCCTNREHILITLYSI